jgi:hypothetical protein
MSKSEEPIALIDTPDGYSRWLMGLAHTWKNIEFVQQAVAQLPSIKAIERKLMGIDGGKA